MFVYKSEQVHSTNGITQSFGKMGTRRNTVSIKNGKGFKAVEIKDTKGRYYKKVPLTKKEIQCIQRNEFVPGLFRDCIKRQNMRKTRRQRK